jgi:hypothetical protein
MWYNDAGPPYIFVTGTPDASSCKNTGGAILGQQALLSILQKGHSSGYDKKQ